MTAALERAVDFQLVELDLLATHAGVRFPFPLQVPSFGHLAGERVARLASAGHALSARGLATGHGPVGIAGELVTALREYRDAVDLVVIGADTVTGVVAMVYGSRAMVCRQSQGGEAAGTVRVDQVPAAALADELAWLVPPAAPAAAMPITLPPGLVDDTLLLLGTGPETPALRRSVRELVREYGVAEDVVDQLVDLFPSVTGRGQLGAVARTGTRAARTREVSWLDSPRGRVRVDRGGDGWMSVNPLRRIEIVHALREATATAGG